MESELKEVITKLKLNDAINNLEECGITSISLFNKLNLSDMDVLFTKRSELHIKIKFRSAYKKWQENNLNYISSEERSSDCAGTLLGQFNLKEVLESTIFGKDILSKYKTNTFLNTAEQNGIARHIVNHFVVKNMKMGPSEMIVASKAVIKLFPNEHEATYYMPRIGKGKPSGKIYDRYCNLKYRNPNTSSAPKKQRTDSSSEDVPNLNELLKIKTFLEYNNPSNLLEKWKETADLRLNEKHCSLHEIFVNWPRYKDSAELIDVDFEYLFYMSCSS